MRSTNILSYGLVLAAGCAANAGGSRGATYAQHAGSIQVVFTNATAHSMCELRMSLEDDKDMGDNWLPSKVASGQSVEFRVKPGRYQATWATCRDGDDPYFAGTLIGETAIDVDQQTQLFTYAADTVVPTKRAAVLTRDYKIVRFSGQEIGPIAKTAPVKVDAFAAAEASLGTSRVPAKAAEQPKPEPAKFSAKGIIDPKAKRTAKAAKPSLARKHDVGGKAKYRAR